MPLTREEEGVGILTGAYLGGKRGILLMQVSGLGNRVNGLASLAIPYQIPFLILISQRGELGEFNPAQVAMGHAARPVLDALDIQHFTLDRVDRVDILLDGAIKTAYASRRPVAARQRNECTSCGMLPASVGLGLALKARSLLLGRRPS